MLGAVSDTSGPFEILSNVSLTNIMKENERTLKLAYNEYLKTVHTDYCLKLAKRSRVLAKSSLTSNDLSKGMKKVSKPVKLP